jgi:hypothetical protein
VRIDAVFGAVGRYAARFRWLVVLLRLAGVAAAATQPPSPNNVSQPNNIKFLPPSAPSGHAEVLAAPFGTAGLVPIPVVAARTAVPLTRPPSRAACRHAALSRARMPRLGSGRPPAGGRLVSRR